MNFKNFKKGLSVSLLGVGMFLLPVGISSCGNTGGEKKSPIEQLQDSLRQQGDSIIVTIDTTQVVVLHSTPAGLQLQSVGVGDVEGRKFGVVEDFIANDSVLIFINKEAGKEAVKCLDLKSLQISPVGQPAEKITFTAKKDSLTFTNGQRNVQTDLSGKSNVETEPGVTAACMKTYKRVDNYTDDTAGGYWGYIYNKPVSFAGYKGKFTCWDGSKFYGFMKTDQGVIVFKRNGNTYLNDEKIGTTKISVSFKYFIGGQYNTLTTIRGTFTALDGSKDSFSISEKSFTP